MPDFRPGQTVQLADGRKGTVRFAGQAHFQVGEWIGIELETKTGKNDGSVMGQRYFDCPAGYGMFVKPMTLTILSQPTPARSSLSRKASRPSSAILATARTSSAGPDAALAKRRSLNTPAQSPGPLHSRPQGLTRSPAKSPTKTFSGPPSTVASRTVTPSTSSRAPPPGPKSRLSVAGHRASMAPPATSTAARAAKHSSVPSTNPRLTPSGGARNLGAPRAAAATPRDSSRSTLGRPASVDSRSGREDDFTEDVASAISSSKSEQEILSPQPRSPSAVRAKALERLTAASASEAPSTPVKGADPGAFSPRTTGNAAAARELEDLKAKLKVLDRKRVEDRDKLKQLEKVRAERDRFQGIIQKLEQKYRPNQQGVSDLKKQLKESEARCESLEAMQAEHDSVLELATLDREMAEETAEVLKSEVDSLKQKMEELELEVDVLREENAEYGKGMTAEERASTGWLQMERNNERLREALLRLRDITQAQEKELRDHISGLEDELKDFGLTKDEHAETKEKLAQSEAAVDDLRQQLDNALGAEDMIEELTERNMAMSEQIDELKTVIEDLESLKEINDELEANHVQNERELQEDLDFKDSIIAEQARRAAQQEEALEDMEYTLSRFRQLVNSLQGDLEDMRASRAVTEGESEKLNDRSRAMMDLNMKLQLSAAKTQVKTIDLELRRLEAQEAEQHLEIVKLFLPESYQEEQDSVLALLKFRRLSFKANLLGGFMRERIDGQLHPGHEDDVLAGCEAVDRLAWVSAMCGRFVNDISHCSMEQWSRYRNALHELEPVERALNTWIDGLRRDDLKEKRCAEELQRTLSLLSHLAEVHISDNLAGFADEAHMKSLLVQSHLDSAAVALQTTRAMAQRMLRANGDGDGDDDDGNVNDGEEEAAAKEMALQLTKKLDLALSQTRSTKMMAGKAARSLEELRSRFLSLPLETKEVFERCEGASLELTDLARSIGNGLYGLLAEDGGRTEPFTHDQVLKSMETAAANAGFASGGASDALSIYLSRLGSVGSLVADLAALAGDLDRTQEFDVQPVPWKMRSEELSALKRVPVEAEEELRRLREEHNEARRRLAERDEHLSTAVLKIETLESRMRNAQANVERIGSLKEELGSSRQQNSSLKEDIEKQDRELRSLELERDKWKKMASDSRALADASGAAGSRAGQERAVATAREMDALRREVESLQSAVRHLREDNLWARTTEQQRYDWLSEPLQKPSKTSEQRRRLVAAEGRDALSELVKMTTAATVFDLATLPADWLAWRPAKRTAQHHAAKQMEDYAAWMSWRDSVVRKSGTLLRNGGLGHVGRTGAPRPAAQLCIRLPDGAGETKSDRAAPGPDGVLIAGSGEWEALQAANLATG